MKTKQIILTAFTIVMAGCGAPKEKEISGVIIDAMKDNVLICSAEDTLMFSTMDAHSEAPDGIHDGDSITVYYTGDAPTAIVSKIVVTRPEALKEKEVKGVVIDGTMNNVMVGVGADTISFSTMDAEKDCPDGMLIGDSITIYYKAGENGKADKIIIPARLAKDKK